MQPVLRRCALLVAAASVGGGLSACREHEGRIAWQTVSAEVYRVTRYESPSCTGTRTRTKPPAPFMQVRRIVGARGSRVEGLDHYALYWCDTPAHCGRREHALHLHDYNRSQLPAEDVITAANARCEVYRQRVTATTIALDATMYAADRKRRYSDQECFAQGKALQPKFSCVSRTSVAGEKLATD